MPDTITYLDRASVRRLLPSLEEQMDRIASTYVAMSQGRVENPPKIGVHARADTFVHAMPAHLAEADVTAVKWVSAYSTNPRQGLPSISGLIVLNDSGTGLPVAVMDAAEITAVRTAAASGVSIRHLAHPGWRRVAILGYGEQGRQHGRVVRALEPRAEIRVYGGPRLGGPLPGVEVVDDPRQAVAPLPRGASRLRRLRECRPRHAGRRLRGRRRGAVRALPRPGVLRELAAAVAGARSGAAK